MIASSPSLKLLVGIFLIWSFFPSVKSQELCTETHAIYSADNLQNGTIRLYSRLYYWDLVLYHIQEPANDSSTSLWTSLWTPVKKLFSLEARKLFVDSDEFRLTAFIDDRDHEKRLISSVYHGLNFSLQDTKTVSHTIVSYSDWQNSEYTYLFETNLAKNASISANSSGRFVLWNTTTGNIVKGYNVNMDHSSDYNLFITGAFNVYFNETQHLFFIFNGKLFFDNSNNLDSSKIHPVLDADYRYHRGIIPHPITASFTIQASEDRIWIVLIYCSHFCLVPWNTSKKFFDFNKCTNDYWKKLDPFFFVSFDNDFQSLTAFQSFGISKNLINNTKLTSNITDFGIEFNTVSNIPKTFKTDWTFISIFSTVLLIIAVFFCLTMAFYCAFERHHSDSYHLAKKEAEAKKQMEMDGINDVEKAPMPSVVEVDEAKVANYINQNTTVLFNGLSGEEVNPIQSEESEEPSQEIESQV